ncbi:MAG: DNA/RNA non-specific endonuclease [Janthinobacterium lividum]
MHLIRILLPRLIAASCPGFAYADASCPQFFPAGQPPALINQKLAVRTTLLCNDAYASLASGVTHGPLWSAEHPTAASLADAAQTHREGRFHADDRLPQADQAQLADYRRSGFDRGHMTPSGDMPGETAQQQSFSLANMVPQTAALNQGIWAGIEGAVRSLTNRDGELFLVTGPAFHSAELKSVGPDGVLVPTSTWKAVYDPRIQGAGVYVCKNTDAPTCDIVSVATLIRVVGIDPFPALPDRLKQVAMVLPQPEASRYAHRGRRQPPLAEPRPLQPLIDWLRHLLST